MKIKKSIIIPLSVLFLAGLIVIPVVGTVTQTPSAGLSTTSTRDLLAHLGTSPFNGNVRNATNEQQSITQSTGQLSAASEEPSISADGTAIAYITGPDNPKPGDLRPGNVYVFNRLTGKTTRASVDSKGAPLQKRFAYTTLSGDGRYVAFCAFDGSDQYTGLLIHDMQTGETTKIAESGVEPRLSANGQFLVFTSGAALVPGDTNGVDDVYLYNMHTQKITRVSVASDGSQTDGRSFWPCISGDGNEIVFVSAATNLAHVYPNTWNVFLHDMRTGKTNCVSNIDGDPMRTAGDLPAISEDGRFIAFNSQVSRMLDNGSGTTADMNDYVLDLSTGQRTRIAYGQDEFTDSPAISGDGRYVAFHKYFYVKKPAGMYAIGQIFVRDMSTGQTDCVSVSSSGVQGTGDSNSPQISSDGRFVTFASGSPNVVAGDTNGLSDIFLRDRVAGTTIRVSMPVSQKTSGTPLPTYPYPSAFPSIATPSGFANKTLILPVYNGSIHSPSFVINPSKQGIINISKKVSNPIPTISLSQFQRGNFTRFYG